MSFYTGTGATLQMGKETTFGTGVAPTHIVDITSESLQVSVEKGDEGSLIAGKTASNRDLLAVNLAGSISGILHPCFAGLLVKAALGGTDTVTEGTAEDTYKHTMKLCEAGDILPSLTFVLDKHAAIKKYAGCTVSALTIEAMAADYVKFTADISGIKEESGTLTSGLAIADKAYKCASATFTIGGNSFDVSGTTLKISNSLEDGDKVYSSGLYKTQPQHGQREVTISFDIPYNAGFETFKDTYLTTEANASIVLQFQADTVHTFKVTLPNVAITDASANISGTGKIGASAEGMALTVGVAEPITIEIVDETSTAY